MKPSRSHMAHALRLMVAGVLATSAVLVPIGTASAADTQTPVLNSFSVSDTTVTPGQQVTFTYDASEAAGSLSQVRLAYLNYKADDVFTFDGPLPITGSVPITLPDTWVNAPATLHWVELTDPSGNAIRYYRSGDTAVSPTGATGPSTHTLPFSRTDLTVTGSTVDSTAPFLASVSASGSPASPGQTISVHYDATDAAGSLKSVALVLVDAYANERTITTTGTGPIPLSGAIDQVIPSTWPNGTYVPKTVTVTDPHGNQSRYWATGGVNVSPWGAQGPSSNTLDFGPATFTVTGSNADFTPPGLTSVQLTGSPLLRGGTATVSYVVESQDPLSYVAFLYADPSNKQMYFGGATTQLTGTQAITIPAGSPLGNYVLQEVLLKDSAGNFIRYQRGGRTITQTPGLQYGTHTIPLESLDVAVVSPPAAPTGISVRARSGSASVLWAAAEPNGSSVTGYTITAQPGGRSIKTSGSATSAELTGLSNGIAYRLSVTATNAFGTSPASQPSGAVTPQMSTNIIGAADFSGDGHNDLIALRSPTTDGNLTQSSFLHRGNGIGGFSGYVSLNHPYNGERIVFSPGDFTGDRIPDLMQIGHFSRALSVERGSGHGGFAPGREFLTSGWGGMRTVFGPGDFSGDHKADIMGINGIGDLYLYRGNGLGTIAGSGQKIGTGWGGFLSVFSPQDFSGDRKADVMAVNTAGELFLFRGNGRGGWAARAQKIGNGWAIYR